MSHVTPLSPHTASDILVVLGRAASRLDNYEDKNTNVKTGLKIASRVCIICLREKEKKPTGWKMEHNKLPPFWKTSIWESSTI